MAAQLNIKDPETVERAQRMARRKGVSVTSLIRDMLRQGEQTDDERIARAYAEFRFRTEGLAEVAREAGLTSDHNWIYDYLYEDDAQK